MKHPYIGKRRNKGKGRNIGKGRNKGRKRKKVTNKGIEGAQFKALAVKCGISRI